MSVKHAGASRALLGVVLLMAPAWAWALGEIVGRVTDRSGTAAFEGASVRIEPLGREVISQRDGRYRIGRLPAGEYLLRVRYLGADQVEIPVVIVSGETLQQDARLGMDVAKLDNVLVVGQAAGQAAALNRSRNADGIVDIVSADAIGQFPDQNAAEALARVPGLSLERDQGEGRFIIVRGIEPALTATTINGLRVPGPEGDSRQVNLDVISSDLLESAEIIKTNLPDMDGDTVGGTIELKGATAFDRGNSLNLRAEASYNELEDETSPKLSISGTRLFSVGEGVDNFGLAAALSHFRRKFGSHGVESEVPAELDGPQGSFTGLEEAEQRDYTITRERLSASLNLDWRPSADLDLHWRTLYSDFSDDEVQLSNVFVFEEGTVLSGNDEEAQFSDIEVEKLDEAREETQEILSTLIGAEQRRGPWTMTYTAGYSLANEDNPGEVNAAFVGAGIPAGYSLAGRRIPALGAGGAFFEPATFELDEIELGDSFTEDTENTLAFDLQRDLDWGRAPGFWKAGLKLRQREKTSDIDVRIIDGFGADLSLADFAQQAVDYPFGVWGPISARGEIAAFVRDNAAQLEVNEDDSAIDSTLEDYRIDEDVLAGYVMAQARFGALRVVGGVRVERTDFDALGNEVRIDEESGSGEVTVTPLTRSRSFTDVLPSVSLRYDWREDVLLRAAYSQTLARPSFEAVAPFAEINIEEDDPGVFEREAVLGNPDLEPLEAQNLDVSMSWYPGKVSVVSAGLFYKRLKRFFVLSDIAGQPGPFADFDEAQIVLNGDTADLFGAEFNAVRKFDFLAPPFDGLLVSANLTLVDGEARLPFREGKVSLPRQSETLGNLALGYQDARLSLRLALNYRSEFLEEINALDDPSEDRFQDAQTRIDFSGGYWLTPKARVYFNAINLGNDPLYAYYADRRFSSQFEEHLRSYELGMSLSF